MTDCLFCTLAQKKIPAKVVSETPTLLAFRDIQPQAPVHILIIPKKHISTLNELSEDDTGLLSETVLEARRIAWQEGIAESGYRLVWNCNAQGGQSVYHLHLHLLGGRAMTWPPG